MKPAEASVTHVGFRLDQLEHLEQLLGLNLQETIQKSFQLILSSQHCSHQSEKIARTLLLLTLKRETRYIHRTRDR